MLLRLLFSTALVLFALLTMLLSQAVAQVSEATSRG